MSAPPLLHHGQQVKPHYAPSQGQTESWAGKSTAEERPDGNLAGIVKRYAKKTKASDKTRSLGLIAKVSDDAIRYSIPAEIGQRGLSMIAGLLTLVCVAWAIHLFSSAYFEEPFDPFMLPIWFAPPILFTVGILIFLWSIRLELFQPIDAPTIFDRKHRKVYRIFSEAQPGLKGLFKPWPLRACEYDWDLIDVEHNAQMVVNTATAYRDHSLVFIVRRSAEDATIIDSFNIGSALILILDETVDATWEHIRRFMEEGGPPLPPGETLPEPTPRRGFWAKVNDANPFRPKYWRWWRDELPVMLLLHFLLPLTIVFGGLWLFFNWLGTKTAKPIEWPQEVIDAVGADVAGKISNEIG